MAPPGSASDSGGSASYNSVFVDTSLGTHLVLMVLDTDTVACFKDKIEKEHPLCFPHIGSVKINAIKVKRRGHFYCLSDSMLVKNAFDGVKKSWFLSVDASSSGDVVENQGLITTNSTKLLVCSGINNKATSNGIVLAPEKRLLNSDHSSLPDDVSKHYSKENVLASEPNGSTSKEAFKVLKIVIKSSGENSQEVSSHDEMLEKEVPITQTTSIEDSSRKVNLDGMLNVSQDSVIGAFSTVKKKHKRKRDEEDSLNDRALNGNDPFVGENGKDPVQREIVFQENSDENAYTRMVKKVIPDEPCHSSSSDAHKKSDYGTQSNNNNLPDGTEFTEKVKVNRSSNEVLMQCSSSLGVSHTKPHASKRRKVETGQGKEEDPLKENRILVSDFNDDQTSKNEDVSHQIGEKQSAIETGNIEGGANLLWSLSSTGKKKGRKKTSNRSSKVDSVTPSLGKHVTEDSSVVSAGINDKNTNGEPESAPIPENGLHGTTSDSLQISLKENHNNSVLEPGESRMHENEDTSQQIGGEHGANEKGDLEDVNQLRTSSRSKKKKKKTKSSNRSSKVDSITSSPGKDVKEHSSTINAGINQQSASGEPKLAPILENDLHSIMTSEALQISLKEKQNDTVLELGETNAPSLKEKEVLAFDSNKEISKTEVISQIIEEKQSAKAALDSLPLSSGKKKKKKKSSTPPNQLDAVNSAPGKDVKDGNYSVTARINQKDSSVEPDAPPVLPQISAMEKQTSSVLELGESKIPSLEEDKVLIADSNKEKSESNLTSQNLRKKRETKSSNPQKQVDSEIFSPRKTVKEGRSAISACINEQDPYDATPLQLSQPFVKEKLNEQATHHPDKKIPEVSKRVAKPQSSNKSDNFNSVVKKPRKSIEMTTSSSATHHKEISEAFTVPNSKTKEHSEVRKDQTDKEPPSSGFRQNEKLENQSQNKNSFLATPKGIFNADSSGSSEDEEDRIDDNSDASTRTPSDNSLSPDNSDVESNENYDSPQIDSNGLKRKDGGGRNARRSGSPTSNAKNLPLRTILRSSSRYKKAKVIASQSQPEDEDSQPADFVPDSQTVDL